MNNFPLEHNKSSLSAIQSRNRSHSVHPHQAKEYENVQGFPKNRILKVEFVFFKFFLQKIVIQELQYNRLTSAICRWHRAASVDVDIACARSASLPKWQLRDSTLWYMPENFIRPGNRNLNPFPSSFLEY